MSSYFKPASLVLLAASAAAALPARAAVIHVPADQPTIQAAVNAAASGDTILIAAGTYEEQVTIGFKSLILQGEAGATVMAPQNMAQTLDPASIRRPIVGAFGSDVTLIGLTIDGAYRGDTNEHFCGVVLLGSNADIENCTVKRVRREPFTVGANEATAPIRAWNNVGFDTPVVNVTVRNCTIEDNAAGIFINGDDSGDLRLINVLRIRVTIEGNTITGQGPTDQLAQIGVHIANGATGQIKNNTISDHIYTLAGDFALGILIGNAPISPDLLVSRFVCVGNTLSNNTVGLAAIFNSQAQIVNNTVTAGPFSFNGIAVSGPGNRIVNNHVTMDASALRGNSGIGLLGLEFGGPDGFGIAVNTRVIANTVSGADVPILQGTGVTGTQLHANVIVP